MKKIFFFLLTVVFLIPLGVVYAQSDQYDRHIDSLYQLGLPEEAHQYAKQRWESLTDNKSQEYKDAFTQYYNTVYLLEMVYRYQENFKEALKLNEEMLALREAETDYFAIRNKIVCYSGLGNYAEAAKNRALLYKAYKKHKLPCESELCHYYNFDFFKVDTLNIWGYEWYDELPKNRFSTSFTKVVYYVYSTNPDGSEKDQLYRLHLIMFHGTGMPFDYIMEKHFSSENGEFRQSMYGYTYKENIDYEKLHNDVKEIVMGGKKTKTQQSSRYKANESFCPDSMNASEETIGTRDKTEYVSTEPYHEFKLFYGHYDQLNISLNGAVKSVVQTKVPVSVLKHDESPESVYAQQQTWLFSKTGKLILCDINKILLKNVHEYDINSSIFLSEDAYDTIASLLTAYFFDATGRMNQIVTEDGSAIRFEYNQNGLLTKMSTYYQKFDVLSEKVITLNNEGKPVRVEEFNYRDELKSRECPSDLGPSGKKSVGVIDAYCYDERGNKVAHQMNNGETVQWMDYFVYDSLDNKIFEGRCDGYDGNIGTCKCKGFRKSQGYEYDDQHRLIREYSIGDWKPSGWDYYYQYDSAGREIEYKHYDVRDTQRTFDRHIQTTYDSAGRMVKKEALLGSFLINEAIFRYTRDAVLDERLYDEHGNLSERVVYQSNDSRPYKIVRYQYTYDQYGNWVKRIRYEGRSKDSMTVTEILERQIQYY